MPKELIIRDFSAGWCPSDDRISGRKNGLLHMEALDIDQNGAIVLQGGFNRIGSAFGAIGIRIFSAYVHGIKYNYVTLADGKMYRDTTLLATAVSNTAAIIPAHIYLVAYNMVMMLHGDVRIADYYSGGIQNRNLGVLPAQSNLTAVDAGAGSLGAGTYEYRQVNVGVFTDYQSYSDPRPLPPTAGVSVTIAASHNITVTPVDNSATSGSNINEVWIYRRGPSTNGIFYRVKQLTSSFSTPFTDNVLDATAISGGIALNESLRSIRYNSSDTTIPYAQVGPIAGRILYVFGASGTSNIELAYSEVDNPENFDSSLNQIIANTEVEIFLDIKVLTENTIAVITTKDIYLMTGTFIKQPDGFMDVFKRSMGIGVPANSSETIVYQNSLIMFTHHGWCITSLSGQQEFLAGVNTDRLFRGEDANGYFAAKGGIQDSLTLNSCAISGDKLYTFTKAYTAANQSGVPKPRLEVYDFARKYWRPYLIIDNSGFNLYWPMASDPDGKVLMLDADDKYLKQLDYPLHKRLNDAAGTKQLVDLLTNTFNLDLLSNRKDSFTFRAKIDTGGDVVTVKIYKDGSTTGTIVGTIVNSGLQDSLIDISSAIGAARSWQIGITGQPGEFILSEMSILYDLRPAQSLFIYVPKYDFGAQEGLRKRIRSWPIVLDTMATTVTITPIVDGSVYGETSQFNSGALDTPRNHIFEFIGDLFAIDVGFKLSAPQPFEFFGLGAPLIVQTLPMGRKFDQMGPKEHFHYAKIKMFETRLLAYTGGPSTAVMPVKFYFEDAIELSTSFTVDNGLEKVYQVGCPKTTSGHILRVELGPVDYEFFRIYGRIKAVRSDAATDMEWIDLVDTIPFT